MPELPEVETIRRGLTRKIVGLKITQTKVNLAKITNISSKEFAKLVKGRRVRKVSRFAKILVVDLSGGLSLAIHLKISGQLIYIRKSLLLVKHTHVILSFNNGYELRFIDPRQFGYVKLFKTSELPEKMELDKLGPEPLTKEFTLSIFKKRLNRRPKSHIKPLLMDQHFISGIGNLYADEILFAAKVHPLKRVRRLKPIEVKKIYQHIKPILNKAIKYKGTSVDSYRDAQGKRGLYLQFVKAYDQEGEPCIRCKKPIKRIKIGTRSAYFCPRCQPR